ncbi:MAG: ABC transporter ATP-binding protein [Acidobacteriota bacterium]
MSPIIRCEQLHKTYGNGRKAVEAVRGLDLAVEKGQCFGLLGPNGAGKTTTVEILEGLLEPTAGQVWLFGLQWGNGRDDEIRQRIGITLQETRFQEKLSCLEILTLFRSFYRDGIEPMEALELVSLQEKAHAWVRELSGGQRQRLAVASALVGGPELLFLDEPTTGLDPQARRQLWEVVSDLKARGCTILLTTHYMDEAERLCNTVAVVDQGRVIAEGSPRELIARLGGEHVVEFSIGDGAAGLPEPGEFLGLESVTGCHREAEGYLLTVSHPHLAVPALLRLLETRQWKLNRLTTRHANLEDVFVNLTGRHLRDV